MSMESAGENKPHAPARNVDESEYANLVRQLQQTLSLLQSRAAFSRLLSSHAAAVEQRHGDNDNGTEAPVAPPVCTPQVVLEPCVEIKLSLRLSAWLSDDGSTLTVQPTLTDANTGYPDGLLDDDNAELPEPHAVTTMPRTVVDPACGDDATKQVFNTTFGSVSLAAGDSIKFTNKRSSNMVRSTLEKAEEQAVEADNNKQEENKGDSTEVEEADGEDEFEEKQEGKKREASVRQGLGDHDHAECRRSPESMLFQRSADCYLPAMPCSNPAAANKMEAEGRPRRDGNDRRPARHSAVPSLRQSDTRQLKQQQRGRPKQRGRRRLEEVQEPDETEKAEKEEEEDGQEKDNQKEHYGRPHQRRGAPSPAPFSLRNSAAPSTIVHAASSMHRFAQYGGPSWR